MDLVLTLYNRHKEEGARNSSSSGRLQERTRKEDKEKKEIKRCFIGFSPICCFQQIRKEKKK